MSVDNATIGRVQLPRPVAAEGVPVEVQPMAEDTGLSVWRQINAILNNSVRESGLLHTAEVSGVDKDAHLESPVLIAVAPGIAVETDEYQKRYGSVDLEEYRQQMPPELFKVFVRHIGRVPGTTDLNLGDVVSTPTD